jgi:isopropylmalate/homocitrate/citramalate synthase
MTMPREPVFSAEETAKFRHALDKYREPGAYEPGKWSVSPLNRRAEIAGAFPEKVILRDIAIRTTEQMPGVVLPARDRLRLMQAVAETGVPSIQVGTFGNNRSRDEMRADVRLIKSVNPDCEIVFGGVRGRGDIELAAEVGIDSVQIWAAPYVEAVAITAAQGIYRKAWADEDWRDLPLPNTVEQQIDRARDLVLGGRRHGVAVSTGINQISFAPESYVVAYCRAMAEIGAPEIVLYDGSSGMGPEGYAHMVRLVREHAPKTRIGVHTHNMFDLAVADALAAARSGAEVLEVSVNGYCSASGQADLAATALALEALYGVKTGIKLERLTPLARLGEKVTGYKLAWNTPVTGTDVHNWGGTEFVIQELKVDPLIHWPIEPTLVGNERRWDITFDSGPYTMLDKLRALKLRVDVGLVEPLLARIKRDMRRLRRVLTDREIRAIVRAMKRRTAARTKPKKKTAGRKAIGRKGAKPRGRGNRAVQPR